MKTLIIYTLIPEDQIFFSVPDEELLPEWKAYLDQVNGKIVNIDDINEGMKWLISATSSKSEYCDPSVDKVYHCCLLKYKFELSKDDLAIYGPFSKVYVSGFFL